MTFPRNEKETIELFKLAQHRLGWRIIHLQTAFPDAIIENEQGKRLIVEFEYEDSNYKQHGHPLDGSCDLIVCWKRKWRIPPLPVWELSKYAIDEARLLEQILSNYIPQQELELANHRLGQLERGLAIKKVQLEYESARGKIAQFANLAVVIASLFVLIVSIPIVVGSFSTIIDSIRTAF